MIGSISSKRGPTLTSLFWKRNVSLPCWVKSHHCRSWSHILELLLSSYRVVWLLIDSLLRNMLSWGQRLSRVLRSYLSLSFFIGVSAWWSWLHILKDSLLKFLSTMFRQVFGRVQKRLYLPIWFYRLCRAHECLYRRFSNQILLRTRLNWLLRKRSLLTELIWVVWRVADLGCIYLLHLRVCELGDVYHHNILKLIFLVLNIDASRVSYNALLFIWLWRSGLWALSYLLISFTKKTRLLLFFFWTLCLETRTVLQSIAIWWIDGVNKVFFR